MQPMHKCWSYVCRSRSQYWKALKRVEEIVFSYYEADWKDLSCRGIPFRRQTNTSSHIQSTILDLSSIQRRWQNLYPRPQGGTRHHDLCISQCIWQTPISRAMKPWGINDWKGSPMTAGNASGLLVIIKITIKLR